MTAIDDRDMLPLSRMESEYGVQAGACLDERYHLVEELGRGGVGTVWRTHDNKRGRELAIKVMSPQDKQGVHSATKAGRFIREARAMAKLKSPHIVRILGHGSCAAPDGSGELVYITMDLLDGEALRTRVKRDGAMSPETTMRVLAHIGRAVGLAHQRGIVHRDIKPANVFLCRDARHGFVAKVLDFGLAKSLAAPLATIDVNTDLGRPIGTPYYMSPEQARGLDSVDHRSDLWAMGVIAYECLCGERPFQGKSLARVFSAIAVGEIPVPSTNHDVPAGFDAWFAQAVNRDKQQRFQSAKMMVDELREVLVDATTLSRAHPVVTGTLSDVLAMTLAPSSFGGRTLVEPPTSDSGRSFVERTDQMTAMDAAIDTHCRVITLCGSRGTGRSRLAREWAGRRRDRFPGGIWLCSLAGVNDPAAMWLRIALSLGAQLGAGDPGYRLGRALSGLGRVLVLFEHADKISTHLAPALSKLLRASPRAVFVVTTTRHLDVPTERIVPVDDLDCPPDYQVNTLDEIGQYPAVELFMRRAIAFRNSIVGDDPTMMTRVTRDAHGNPLALEVLAGCAQRASLEQISSGLAATLAQPGGTTIIEPDALVTGAVSWVLATMEPYLRSTMVQAAAFRHSFTAQAAEAVVDLGSWDDAPAVAVTLTELVRRHLLLSNPAGHEERYSMHPVVYDACWSALCGGYDLGVGDTPDAVLARHGRFFAQLGSAESLDALHRRGGWVRRNRYLVDIDNTIAACERAVRRDDGSTAASCALAAAVTEQTLSGHAAAAQRLVAPIAIKQTPSSCRIRCMVTQGAALLKDGRADAAHQVLTTAVEAARTLHLHHELASALRHLSRLYLALGRPSMAHTTSEEARLLSLRYGDRMGHADTLTIQADAQQESGDVATAQTQLEQALMAYQQVGARRRQAELLEQLGQLHGDSGRLDASQHTLEQALSIQRELGDRHAEARLLGAIGERCLKGQQLDRAMSMLQQASARGRELGACKLEGRFLGALGDAYAALNQHERAWATVVHGEKVLRADQPDGSAELLQLLCRRARLEIARQTPDVARATLQEVEAMIGRVGTPPAAVGRELVGLRHALRIDDPPSVY